MVTKKTKQCEHENWYVIDKDHSKYDGEERHICEDCGEDLIVIDGE